jgi:hypothetical protein
MNRNQVPCAIKGCGGNHPARECSIFSKSGRRRADLLPYSPSSSRPSYEPLVTAWTQKIPHIIGHWCPGRTKWLYTPCQAMEGNSPKPKSMRSSGLSRSPLAPDMPFLASPLALGRRLVAFRGASHPCCGAQARWDLDWPKASLHIRRRLEQGIRKFVCGS